MSKHLQRLQQRLQQDVAPEICCSETHDSLLLEGTVAAWPQVVRAGKLAAHHGYKGVVNHLTVSGLTIPPPHAPQLRDDALDGIHVDVLIIGGGVIGCFVARELTRRQLSVLVVDKEDDVAAETSSRNDGMVHPGIEPHPGSNKARFNARGNAMYDTVAAELGVPFFRCGTLILYQERWEKVLGPILLARARQNGVPGVRMLSKKEALSLEPSMTHDIAGAVLMPTTGLVSPYLLTVACAENAVQNGARVSLNTMVTGMSIAGGKITAVTTNRGMVVPDVVVNAAGIYADTVAAMAGDEFFTIHPRKGEIVIFDRKKGDVISHVVAEPDIHQTRSDTKGGCISRTVDGNVLIGPNAFEQPFREDYSTVREHINQMMRRYLPLVPAIVPSDLITYFAGTRPATYEEDFIIEQSSYVGNLVHAAGIQSPGLASTPAIAEEVASLVDTVLARDRVVRPNASFDGHRRGIPDLARMPWEERDALIRQRPDYGIIVCRCEGVSEGQVRDALHSSVPATSVDAVKRRVRAGMGRCQGGFCMPQVMRLITEETGTPLEQVTKKGNGSCILAAETKKEEDPS